MGNSENTDFIQAWSDMLWGLWTTGSVFDGFAERYAPGSREEGYAIQALLEQRSRRPLFGWKIAATSEAGQKHINVSGPIAGRLLAERVRNDGATIDLTANRMRVAEPEFVFRIAKDLGPENHPWSASDVLDAVDTLHLALEVPDSRYSDFTVVGEARLIADNACAHELILGPATNADWRTLDLVSHPVSAVVRGRFDRQGEGANVLGDPREALTWLVNEVTGMGLTVRAGQMVITGTCMVPLELQPGDNVSVDFGVLGRIGLQVVAAGNRA